MEKELQDDINLKGIDIAIKEYLDKKETMKNRFWIALWLLTILAFGSTFVVQQTKQNHDEKYKYSKLLNLYQKKIDSLQYFVDTSLDFDNHFKNKIYNSVK